MRHQTPEPGEWQTDEHGRRYRMIGNCKEFEPEINGIPESVFFRSQQAQREQRARELAEEQRRAAERAAQRRNCPFRDGMQTDCSREACALFLNGCTLTRLTDRPPAKATQGLQCPLSKYRAKCREDCALYKNGCTLTAIKTNRESEEK